MSLIEQAAKRLEELRRAGAETADVAAPSAAPEKAAVAARPEPTPEAAMSNLAVRMSSLAGLAAVESERVAATAKHATGPAVRPEPPPKLEIDLERLRSRGFVTPDAPKSQIAEEFRIIKRPILSNVRDRGAGAKTRHSNLIMVTSALPGEGKTFTSINLAMSIAMEIDTTVLLVDGDVAHPDTPNLLGGPSSPGLLDVLTNDGIDVADALLRTNIPNLAILPAGSHHRRATELLASEQMAILLRELASRYHDRIIIFDSPPLLATTEARVLATHMGQIVMVVAADNTRQKAVKLALSTIERCEVVLMMLNKAEKTDVGAYYDYYADDLPRK